MHVVAQVNQGLPCIWCAITRRKSPRAENNGPERRGLHTELMYNEIKWR